MNIDLRKEAVKLIDIDTGKVMRAESITQAAEMLGRHPSTVSRAASGDRGCMSVANKIVSYDL